MPHSQRFEALVLPHLDAAYNLARWLVRDEHVADDIVQEACLRAYRYFDALRGEDARPWLLGIVRRGCFTWLQEQRQQALHVELDDDDADELPAPTESWGKAPDEQLDQRRTQALVDRAILALEPAFREVIVLRELEDLSYAEIAQIVHIPVGTVMSRLSRARAQLKIALAEQLKRH